MGHKHMCPVRGLAVVASLLWVGAGDLFLSRPAWASGPTLTTLVTFTSTHGRWPYSSLITDNAGNLYGTTVGGDYDGTLFKLSGLNHQTLTTLVQSHTNSGLGRSPYDNLIADAAGNLYGTTNGGGVYESGTVFKLSGPNHQNLTTLVSLNYQSGDSPYAGLTADAAGNFYGTTNHGGLYDGGTVFELSGPNHQSLTTLVSFSVSVPRTALVRRRSTATRWHPRGRHICTGWRPKAAIF